MFWVLQGSFPWLLTKGHFSVLFHTHWGKKYYPLNQLKCPEHSKKYIKNGKLVSYCILIYCICFRHLTHLSSLFMSISSMRTAFLLESSPHLWVTLLGKSLVIMIWNLSLYNFPKNTKEKKKTVSFVLWFLSGPLFRYTAQFTMLTAQGQDPTPEYQLESWLFRNICFVWLFCHPTSCSSSVDKQLLISMPERISSPVGLWLREVIHPLLEFKPSSGH